MLVALALGAALLLLAGPGYRDWIAGQRQMNAARALAGMLSLARTEAVKRGMRVNVCKSPDGARCAERGTWDLGFLMHADADGDGEVPPEGPLRSEPRAAAGITIAGNGPVAAYVSFTSLGHARKLDGALQMGTFTVCAPGRPVVEVVLANTGRVRVERSALPCP